MPKWPFKEPSDPAGKALYRIEEARKNGAQGLNLSNQLSTLPEAIGQLTQLRSLDLAGNQLSTLPGAIGQLSMLQRLDLSGNQLRTLPEAIGQLSQLQELYLRGNRLSTLPEAIGQLSQLQRLFLRSTQLGTLPEALQNLEKLEWLFLHGNPDLGLPDEVLGRTIDEVFRSQKPPREILDYYFAKRGAEGQALREVKLIVVGWGKAGKTTLVKSGTLAPRGGNHGAPLGQE